MNLFLYNNGDDPNVVKKTLTSIGESISCQLTNETDVENPDILVDYNANYMGANYFYLPFFNRYYFYREAPTVINGNQLLIKGHVDVLMSHQESLLSTLIIAKRSSSAVNPYIPDPYVGSSGKITTVYRRAGATPFGFGSNNYVLTIGGK